MLLIAVIVVSMSLLREERFSELGTSTWLIVRIWYAVSTGGELFLTDYATSAYIVQPDGTLVRALKSDGESIPLENPCGISISSLVEGFVSDIVG